MSIPAYVTTEESPVLGIAPAPGRSAWRNFVTHRNGQVGLALLGLYLVLILLGPLLMASNPSVQFEYQNLHDTFLPPSGQHLLGTDQLGRDVLVRLLLGARYTLLIGAASVLLGLAIGVPLGAISGYFSGWPDLLIQRLVDIVLAFPSFLLALALVAVLGPGLTNVVVAVGVSSFPRFVRLLRASVLAVREYPFVEAARALGVDSPRILARHVVPNAFAPIIVQASAELGGAILTAAGLGFLGLGVQQPTPEWGSILGSSRDYIFSDPRLVTYPGLCIFGIVLAFNLMGDALRDVMDPRFGDR